MAIFYIQFMMDVEVLIVTHRPNRPNLKPPDHTGTRFDNLTEEQRTLVVDHIQAAVLKAEEELCELDPTRRLMRRSN